MKKSEYVAALIELANFVESKDFPDQWGGWYGNQEYDSPELIFYVANKEHFGTIISSLGAFEKSGDTISTDATKRLSLGSNLRVWGKKENVCERVVVGTRTVAAEPEKIIPAKPEREEEIVEWKCPESFMALKEDAV